VRALIVGLFIATIVVAACTADSPPPPAASIDQAFADAARIPNVTSLSVHRGGSLVREQFFAGTDATTPHDVRSVTKTVTSLLIGIAIDTGCLTSVDQPIGPLLGADAPSDPAKAAITIRDLLTMTSGFQWSELGAVGDYDTWAGAPDQVQFVLARPLAASPGTTFNYNSGAIHLLSAILTGACGPTPAFAEAHLFTPLGLAPTHTWEMDNQGLANGAAGLQLATPELTAIGQLILDNGMTGTTRVVSSAYLAAMTSPQIPTGDTTEDTPDYGFGEWIGSQPSGAPFLLSEGFGGQFIVVVPDRQAIIVATTNWQGVGADPVISDYNRLYAVILTQILPAL
jgi:CubicO group peptidase (beta-lactamase class C family)